MPQVYAILATKSRRVKIGITTNFQHRLPAYRTHCTEPIEVLMVIEYGGNIEAARGFEQTLLKYFRENQRVSHGEWIKPTEDQIAEMREAWPTIYRGAGDGIPWTESDTQRRRAIHFRLNPKDFCTLQVRTTQGAWVDIQTFTQPLNAFKALHDFRTTLHCPLDFLMDEPDHVVLRDFFWPSFWLAEQPPAGEGEGMNRAQQLMWLQKHYPEGPQ